MTLVDGEPNEHKANSARVLCFDFFRGHEVCSLLAATFTRYNQCIEGMLEQFLTHNGAHPPTIPTRL